jgi:PTH1 family peptidyl-tRNA hydrolase
MNYLCSVKYLIVGLGNPGDEYAQTRHNIGFDVLDRLAASTSWELSRHGWVCEVKYKGRTLILLKPNTYMNLSGKALVYWMQQEKIKLENVMVVVDDLSLPLAQLRLRHKGSDGGHNGLKSIQASLNSDEYSRLKFGIGNDFPKGRQVDFVLGKWKPEEKDPIDKGIDEAISSILSFVQKQ